VVSSLSENGMFEPGGEGACDTLKAKIRAVPVGASVLASTGWPLETNNEFPLLSNRLA
jgi:hypothetical protein